MTSDYMYDNEICLKGSFRVFLERETPLFAKRDQILLNGYQ